MIRIFFKAAFRLVSLMMNVRRKRASYEQTSIAVKVDIITESENLKLFDVTIDNRLNFNEHIKYRVQKSKAI